jgi:hypothetical protein
LFSKFSKYYDKDEQKNEDGDAGEMKKISRHSAKYIQETSAVFLIACTANELKWLDTVNNTSWIYIPTVLILIGHNTSQFFFCIYVHRNKISRFVI